MLNHFEIDYNRATLGPLLSLQNLPANYDTNPLLNAVLDFVAANDISLRNTTNTEENNLIELMCNATNLHLELPQDTQALQTRLNAWKKTLSNNAIYGQGNPVEDPANVSMAASLLATGGIRQGYWGTEEDLRLALQGIAPHDSVKFLQPATLTNVEARLKNGVEQFANAQEEIRDKLQTAIDALKPNEAAILCLPVNSGRAHWRLVKAVVRNKQLESVELVDSLRANPAVKTTPAFINLQAAIDAVAPQGKKIEVVSTATGDQTNSFSCIDNVYREMLATGLIDDEITQIPAKNAAALRLALAKRIARNHPQLGVEVANHLQYNAAGAICNTLLANNAANEEDEQSSNTTNNNSQTAMEDTLSEAEEKFFDAAVGAHQVEFDDVLARNLKQIYDADKSSTSEKVLFERAVRQTVREGLSKGGLTFFAAKKSNTGPASSTPANDSGSTPSPTK